MNLRFQRKQLSIPYVIFLLCFVIAPVLVVFYYAFTNGEGRFTVALPFSGKALPLSLNIYYMSMNSISSSSESRKFLAFLPCCTFLCGWFSGLGWAGLRFGLPCGCLLAGLADSACCA